MATPLITVADVEARIGRPLSEAESARIDALIADASAEIRGYTGQTITPATSTVTLPVLGGRVSLPQRPVTAVEAVNGHPVDEDDVVGPTLHGLWGQYATVTYRHGYDEVPGDLVAVAVAMVLRGMSTDLVGPMKSRETIGDYSYGLPESALARRVVVDRTDQATLDRYRLPQIGAVWLSEARHP